jgi:hypothetical protein
MASHETSAKSQIILVDWGLVRLWWYLSAQGPRWMSYNGWGPSIVKKKKVKKKTKAISVTGHGGL